jgi:thiamine pyrophosphate-dependent acetolactate synthase large subunit-like protein
LGLGLALAQPSRGVIILNGDGCMLMSLGSLVTMANHPAKVFLVVLDNALYEVTGGQRTAGSGHVDFAEMARAAGMPASYTFDNVAAWRQGIVAVLSGPAPALVWLKVEARYGQKTPPAPGKMADQIARLKTALAV